MKTGMNIVAVVLVAVLAGTVVLGVEVTFPDANMEAAVRAELGIAFPNPITDTDMATMTGEFSASTASVSNIQGIEHATNLDTLWLAGNQISDISPVSGLVNLNSLNLQMNQINNMSAVSGLTNLQYLQMWTNQISDISAVAGLANLTHLNMRDNQVSDITPIVGLTNLTDLIMSENQITDISAVSGLTGLSMLALYENQISDISAVSGLTNLTSLLLESNQISDISVISGLANLEMLFLNNNQISDVSAVSGLTNLKWLFLHNNQIEVMNLSNSDLSSLESFVIYGNPLTSVILEDAILSQTNLNALMAGTGVGTRTGIAELAGVLDLDMRGVDFAGISDLSAMYTMDGLEELLLAGATNLDGDLLSSLIGELDSLDLLDVTGLWDTFDVATQGSLNSWDAIEGNTLVVNPEPATLALLTLGSVILLRDKRRV